MKPINQTAKKKEGAPWKQCISVSTAVTELGVSVKALFAVFNGSSKCLFDTSIEFTVPQRNERLSSVCSVISEMFIMGSVGRLGQLDMTPVTRALGRHLCIDLSPEGLAARNCRGIAVVVYGAPQTGDSL